MSLDEITAIIKEYAAELGRVPSMAELEGTGRVSRYHIDKTFGSFAAALNACGLQGRGCGFPINDDDLFQEWALMVRRLGKVPTTFEYQKYSKRSTRPLLNRFKTWKKIPEGILTYLRKGETQGEWDDVIQIILERLSRKSKSKAVLPSGPKIYFKETFYGPPLFPSVVTYAPINEPGVIVLFAAMAKDLGFTITHIQTEFPDGEVMREVEYGRWQRLRVEFEYESRNFVAHGHSVDGCELIVCWHHNWEECPLEVLELRSIVEKARKRDLR
jgi:hypothetical protein